MHGSWLRKKNTKTEEDGEDFIPITLLRIIIILLSKYNE